MTTRRDVLIGIAGVAAAAAVPIKAIAEPVFEFTAKYPGAISNWVWVVFDGAQWLVDGGPVTINGIVAHRLSDKKPLFAGEIAVGEIVTIGE